MLRSATPEDFALEVGPLKSEGNFVRDKVGHARIGWEQHLRFGPSHLKCTEVDKLIGDPGGVPREISVSCCPDR